MKRKDTSAGLIDVISSGLSFADIKELSKFKNIDATPEFPEHPIVRPRDVWLLGDHRIICGDSTDPETVAMVIGSDRPHLMVTDPPYGVEYNPDWRNNAFRSNGSPSDGRAVGSVLNDERVDWSAAWRLFPGDVAYIWHDCRRANEVQASLEVADFVIRAQIIWNKSRFVIGRGDYHWKHETCWYAVRNVSTAHWQGARDQTTVWDIPHVSSETGHGTQKPIECMQRPMRNNSEKGDYIYEPFCGSGTTIIAAQDIGRCCLAVELNPLYVYVTIVRWQNYIGQTAILDETGENFAEVFNRRKNDPERIVAPRGKALPPSIVPMTFVPKQG